MIDTDSRMAATNAPEMLDDGRLSLTGHSNHDANSLLDVDGNEDQKLIRPEPWKFKMTWSGKVIEFELEGDDRLYDLKGIIYSLISVSPERQKLIGLTKGKLPGDETCVSELQIPHIHRFTCVGTSQEDTFKDPHTLAELPETLDDFDVSYTEENGGVAPAKDPRNLRMIKQKIERCTIDIMNPPRPGKKLLVLDLDYTIVDTKPLLSGALPPSECCRPGLHEFLELVYPYYDIAVWSQTHWRWLETKLVDMGVIGDVFRNYKISFVADRTSMFPIFSVKNGATYKHEVKPLAFLYAKFPQWSNKNTIHIDDLSRNFALNPGEGLKIRAYKTAGDPTAEQDRQLVKLGRYLMWLATVEDFAAIDHRQWKKFRSNEGG